MNLSQKQFGEKIGLTRSGISNIENGIRSVSERHILLILSAFPNVSESWLREGEGRMFSEADTTEAERLAKKYSFPDICEKLLETFNRLEASQQEVVLKYAQDFIATIIADAEIERETEAYRAELIEKKRAEAESSVSETGNDAV